MSNRIVLKTDGNLQDFSFEKLKKSLIRSGASIETASDIAKDIEKEFKFKTTREIHQKAFDLLKKNFRPVAGRYNLKKAVMQLGPSGFPFEKFVSRLLDAKGYSTEVGKIVRGMCIEHEIDVLAKKNDRHFMFECKFHNSLGFKSDVQTVLYIKARFDDIKKRWEEIEKKNKKNKHLHKAWIVTNTHFTQQAKDYAQCSGVELMSWEYPTDRSLVKLIDETGLHPITAITSLNNKQKNYLISHDLILCNEIENKVNILSRADIYGKKLELVLKEAKAIYSLKETL